MMKILIKWIICFIPFQYLVQANPPNVCPETECPLVEIPDDCRKAEFTIGTDFETRCRSCDSNICGDYIDVCPQILCPKEEKIKKICRRPNYVIGTDGITKCRVCDTSVCGKRRKVCRVPKCSQKFIPEECRGKTYEIGRDGITKCRVCDRNICRQPSLQ